MSFHRELVRKGSEEEPGTTFAKTWFDPSVGVWSVRRGKKGGFLIACLAFS
jgi:hypothetical protein